MTTSRDPDRLLAAYLSEGMETLPDRVTDAVLDEVHRTRQRVVIGPWRTPLMTSTFKLGLGAAAAVAIAAVGVSLLPGVSGPGGPPSPSPLITPSPVPTPSGSPTADRMIVGGPDTRLTIELPAEWENNDYAAAPDAGVDGEPFFLSVPATTFDDPCARTGPNAVTDRTVNGLATAISAISGVAASERSQTTVAGFDATYLELTGPATLPCAKPILWLDSPQGEWWLTEPNQVIRVYILDVDGKPIVISARSGPDSTDEDKAALTDVLDTIIFDGGP
jgi:hypothetical protein